ncbi:MAG: hypothetical protein MUF42_04770 [Cytophagaceae bacterium]|jgi:hypothetical protein|nr:hypothetical protein [Cytophagaceae bacterium]
MGDALLKSFSDNYFAESAFTVLSTVAVESTVGATVDVAESAFTESTGLSEDPPPQEERAATTEARINTFFIFK